MKNNDEHYICPICGESTNKFIRKISSAESANHFVSKIQFRTTWLRLKKHIDLLWGGDVSKIVFCKRCNFIFSYPFIAGDSKFYNLAYKNNKYPKWKWEHQLTLDVLKKINIHKLIEIGAGSGVFVSKIIESIDKSKILCFEYSSIGKRMINKIGVNCIDIDIRKYETTDKYDVICLFQVLEHLDNIDSLFDKLNKLTSPGAHIFISTPNPYRISFNESNGGLLDMPPNHIGRWSKKTFSHISKKYCWKIAGYALQDEPVTDKVKNFFVFRFLNRRKTGKVDSNIKQKKYYKYIIQYLLIFLDIITHPNLIYKISEKKFGGSQWIHLIRE